MIAKTKNEIELPDGVGVAIPKLGSVTIGLPVYNEESIVEHTIKRLLDYLSTIESDFDYEILIVNDGSHDNTAKLANALAGQDPRVRVIHHPYNRGLCQALKTIFANAQTDYLVTLDFDLSYEPYHIKLLLDKIITSKAQIVLASPYMEGGQVSNVPFKRKWLSIIANRFLRVLSPTKFSTYTGMVRAYEVPFIQSLDLKAWGMDVNPEIIYKTLVLRARIEEIPAHLKWEKQEAADTARPARHSSMRVYSHTFGILFAGFIFRPFLFFFIPGFLLMLVTLALAAFIGLQLFAGDWNLSGLSPVGIVGAATLFLALLTMQMLTIAVLSMQNKRYFEELYHLSTAIFKNRRPNKKNL